MWQQRWYSAPATAASELRLWQAPKHPLAPLLVCTHNCSNAASPNPKRIPQACLEKEDSHQAERAALGMLLQRSNASPNPPNMLPIQACLEE